MSRPAGRMVRVVRSARAMRAPAPDGNALAPNTADCMGGADRSASFLNPGVTVVSELGMIIAAGEGKRQCAAPALAAGPAAR